MCPLTLDHEAVMEAVNDIQLAPPVGTNIGDALAWALDPAETRSDEAESRRATDRWRTQHQGRNAAR